MEENIALILHDFGLSNGLLDVTSKAQATNEKHILNFLKIKILHHQENELKTHRVEKNICKSCLEKELVSRKYKELL